VAAASAGLEVPFGFGVSEISLISMVVPSSVSPPMSWNTRRPVLGTVAPVTSMVTVVPSKVTRPEGNLANADIPGLLWKGSGRVKN
jgi:hypothetical protein